MTKPRRNCSVCPTGRTSGRLCAACVAAKKDKESAWDLKQAGGYWRHVRGGVQEWVPLLTKLPEPEEDEEPEEERGELRTCAYDDCGSWFMALRKTHTYCSHSCRDSAAYERRVARRRELVA